MSLVLDTDGLGVKSAQGIFEQLQASDERVKELGDTLALKGASGSSSSYHDALLAALQTVQDLQTSEIDMLETLVKAANVFGFVDPWIPPDTVSPPGGSNTFTGFPGAKIRALPISVGAMTENCVKEAKPLKKPISSDKRISPIFFVGSDYLLPKITDKERKTRIKKLLKEKESRMDKWLVGDGLHDPIKKFLRDVEKSGLRHELSKRAFARSRSELRRYKDRIAEKRQKRWQIRKFKKERNLSLKD